MFFNEEEEQIDEQTHFQLVSFVALFDVGGNNGVSSDARLNKEKSISMTKNTLD